MPAAAVIPAPIAYINVVAVKKLVVGSRRAVDGWLFDLNCLSVPCCLVGGSGLLLTECPGAPSGLL